MVQIVQFQFAISRLYIGLWRIFSHCNKMLTDKRRCTCTLVQQWRKVQERRFDNLEGWAAIRLGFATHSSFYFCSLPKVAPRVLFYRLFLQSCSLVTISSYCTVGHLATIPHEMSPISYNTCQQWCIAEQWSDTHEVDQMARCNLKFFTWTPAAILDLSQPEITPCNLLTLKTQP